MHRFVDGRRQLFHDGLRRPDRGVDRGPERDLVIEPRFFHGWYVGDRGRTRARGHRERAHGADANILGLRWNTVDHHGDPAGQQVGHRGAGAAVGHMHDVDARLLLEELLGKMHRRPGARRGEAVAAGIGLQQRDELPQIFYRNIWRHDHDRSEARYDRDGREIPHPLVGQLLGDRGMHDAGGRMIEQRVSVRLCFHHGVGRDGAAGAALVLHEDLLAEHAAERLRYHARGRVDPAARGKRNDELDRPRWKFGLRAAGRREQRDGGDEAA
jgi:hypothetical protein